MSAGGPSILLVDDDPDICRNLSDILGDLDYRVAVAHDGPSALELARRCHYDVALLDLRMPGMDGLTLYRRIKQVSAGTVAIIVTGYASEATTREALAAGAWRVMSKPIDLPALLGVVDEALGRPLVLIVDDDRALCASLWDVLRDRGYRVGLAHDAAEAVRHLNDQEPRVVLIDLRLPGGDGGSVFRLVRAAKPEARTILITGQRSEVDRLIGQVLTEGADAVCYKPFDLEALLATLERLTR